MSKIKIITILLYALLIIGECLVFRKDFQSIYYNALMKGKMKQANAKAGKKQGNEALTKLNTMLQVVFNSDSEGIALTFLMVSAGLATISLAIVGSIYSLRVGIIAFFGIGCLPFLLVRLKMQNFQVELSKEGEDLISSLLGNYLLNYQNIRAAIEGTARELDGAPNSKRMLYNLARSLTKANTTEEVDYAIEKFRYSLSTSWGDILANNIRFAYVDGIKITDALRDLSDGISKARKSYEQNKRENNESNIMIKVIFPLTVLAIPIGAVKLFDFTFKKFFEYQFGTEIGMMWSLLLIVGYVICVIITSVLTHQKMDI